MRRKLMVVLLCGAISLLAVTPVLAAQYNIAYNLEEYEELTGKKMEYQEAPMLRTMVAAGELPPLEERLPEDPLVVKPAEEIGQYGGTLRRIKERGTAYNYAMNFGFEFLIQWSNDLTYLYPNVLKGWKASEDAKTYTLYLRKGMKWSDGHPFTTDDFMFWYEDIALNKDLYPTPPSQLMVGGEVGVWRKIDDHTLEITFSVPSGLFLEQFARWRPNPFSPKHYLSQFHPKYTSEDEIEKMVKEGGFDTWPKFFHYRFWGSGYGGNTVWETPEAPVITAWMAQDAFDLPLQTMVRNPYYWKVDTEGNQLPYIDKMERLVVMTNEAILLMCLAGDIDIENLGYIQGTSTNLKILMDHREKGNYRMNEYITSMPHNAGTIYFNYSHEDPVLRELFNDKRFRIALSVAMDREEMNQLVMKGQSEPAQPIGTLRPGPPYYGEKLGIDYLQYDPELANQLLDEIGYTERDVEGYRVRPDGKRLRIVNSVNSYNPNYVEMAELYKGYWKEIGLQVVNKPITDQGYMTMLNSLRYDIATHYVHLGSTSGQILTRMRATCGYAQAWPGWTLWIESEGEQGTEPPEDLLRMIELREKAVVSPNAEVRDALIVEIFKIFDENLFWIGGLNPIMDPPILGGGTLVNNRIKNFPRRNHGEWLHHISAAYSIKE